jgi:hypothetical protein
MKMSKPPRLDLRVIVKMVAPPPTPHTWSIIDDVGGRETVTTSDRFKTSALAWQAGQVALEAKKPGW